MEGVGALLAPDVVYHDMIYDQPFRGRQEMMDYLRKVRCRPNEIELVLIVVDVTGGRLQKIDCISY